MILTHVSDVEASSIGAVVRGPAQQELVACGRQAERGLNVPTEGGQVLAVDVGTWTQRVTLM